MAFQLSSIGAAGASVGRVLPAALRGVHGLGKGLEFAGRLEQTLQAASGQGTVLAQIAGMLQGGTPISSIVEHIAGNLSGALLQKAGNAVDSQAQTALQRALASALAPPGTSPPATSGAKQAAALEQQLTNVITELTRETNAGQQSEFSGKILDAASARETPAPQTKITTAQATPVAAAAVDSLVQSLLSAVASKPANLPGATGNAAASPSTGPTQAQGTQSSSPSDVLSRILARAASADAQRNGSTPSRVAPPVSGNSSSPATLFERLIAAVTQQQADSQANTDGGKGQPQGFQSPLQPQKATAAGTESLPFTAQNSGVTALTSQTPGQPQAAAPYTTVDPSAVIEQLVKGITMRSSGATSEVNLRLQPEHLGDVSLKLTVTGNTITANVFAQNADVRDALLGNQQQLVRSLAEAGLSLGKFSVNVSGGNAGFTQQQSQQQTAHARGIAAGGSLLSHEDGTWEDQRFGPSLVGGTASLVFNYLA